MEKYILGLGYPLRERMMRERANFSNNALENLIAKIK